MTDKASLLISKISHDELRKDTRLYYDIARGAKVDDGTIEQRFRELKSNLGDIVIELRDLSAECDNEGPIWKLLLMARKVSNMARKAKTRGDKVIVIDSVYALRHANNSIVAWDYPSASEVDLELFKEVLNVMSKE